MEITLFDVTRQIELREKILKSKKGLTKKYVQVEEIHAKKKAIVLPKIAEATDSNDSASEISAIEVASVMQQSAQSESLFGNESDRAMIESGQTASGSAGPAENCVSQSNEGNSVLNVNELVNVGTEIDANIAIGIDLDNDLAPFVDGTNLDHNNQVVDEAEVFAHRSGAVPAGSANFDSNNQGAVLLAVGANQQLPHPNDHESIDIGTDDSGKFNMFFLFFGQHVFFSFANFISSFVCLLTPSTESLTMTEH